MMFTLVTKEGEGQNMSREILIKAFNTVLQENIGWNLYFFKISSAKKCDEVPYSVEKIRFRNEKYLVDYSNSLCRYLLDYKIQLIEEIKEYSGDNPNKICCKISTKDALISNKYEMLYNYIGSATTSNTFKSKYSGYILVGDSSESNANIMIVKMVNPIIKLEDKKRSVFYDPYSESELEPFTDVIYKLQYDADFIVIDNMIYSFNYKFEDLFYIQKTLKKVKEESVKKIIKTDALSNQEAFERYAKAYRSLRTFITLDKDKLELIKKEKSREKLATDLNLQLDKKGKIVVCDYDETSRLIRYLCKKIIKEYETKDMLSVSNAEKLKF